MRHCKCWTAPTSRQYRRVESWTGRTRPGAKGHGGKPRPHPSRCVLDVGYVAFHMILPRHRRGRAANGRDDDEPRVGAALKQLANELSGLLPDRTPKTVVLLHMALLSINAAVQAAATTGAPEGAVIAAAHHAARLITRDLSPTLPEDR